MMRSQMLHSQFLLSVTGIMLMVCGCGKETVGIRTDQGTLNLEFVFQDTVGERPGEQSPSRLTVDSLSIEISGGDMATIRHVVSVEDGVAEGTITGIPVGSSRAIYALAWSVDPTVDLYEGSDTVAIEAGRATEATLIMIRMRDDVVAHLVLVPDSTFVNMTVVADASSSFDYYLPDSLLSFRFLQDGAEIRPWSSTATDTVIPTTKGAHTVTVEVRNNEGATGQVDAILAVLNRPPGAPGDPSPGVGDTVYTLSPVLGWSAGDADGDDLVFELWIGEDSLAVLMEETTALMFETEAESIHVPALLGDTAYFWKVIALDGESAVESILWYFFVPPVPADADPDSVAFICDIDEEVVTLYNLSTGPVGWSATWTAEWLNVTPSSGMLARTPQPVDLSVTSRSGYEPGFLNDSVTFTASGFELNVLVQLEINPDLDGPLPDQMVLADPAFADSVEFGNAGCGDLAWQVTDIQGGWLGVDPTSGIVAEDAMTIVAIAADTAGLSPGNYAGLVDFTIVGSVHSVAVVLEIPPAARLDVDPIPATLDSPSSQGHAASKTGEVRW